MKNIKRIILFVSALAVIFGGVISASSADASTRIRGYYRKSGTYVAPHYRSDSDGYRWNNWSTKGNYNPYTGSKGYRNYYLWY